MRLKQFGTLSAIFGDADAERVQFPGFEFDASFVKLRLFMRELDGADAP